MGTHHSVPTAFESDSITYSYTGEDISSGPYTGYTTVGWEAQGFASLAYSTIDLYDVSDNSCSGGFSCSFADLGVHNAESDSRLDFTGFASFYSSTWDTTGYSNRIRCLGDNSCVDSTFAISPSDTTSMLVNGVLGAAYSTISGGADLEITGGGLLSLFDTDVTSGGSSSILDVYLSGMFSGYNLTINCQSSDTCTVYCLSSHSCYNTNLNCDSGATCIVDGCEDPNIVCASVNETQSSDTELSKTFGLWFLSFISADESLTLDEQAFLLLEFLLGNFDTFGRNADAEFNFAVDMRPLQFAERCEVFAGNFDSFSSAVIDSSTIANFKYHSSEPNRTETMFCMGGAESFAGSTLDLTGEDFFNETRLILCDGAASCVGATFLADEDTEHELLCRGALEEPKYSDTDYSGSCVAVTATNIARIFCTASGACNGIVATFSSFGSVWCAGAGSCLSGQIYLTQDDSSIEVISTAADALNGATFSNTGSSSVMTVILTGESGESAQLVCTGTGAICLVFCYSDTNGYSSCSEKFSSVDCGETSLCFFYWNGQDETSSPTTSPTFRPTQGPTMIGALYREPLIEWNFDNTTADIDESLSELGYDGMFDFTIYESNSPKSDPFDSSGIGPYLDGNGHLICGAQSGNQAFVLTNEQIPFETTAPKSFEAWVYNTDLDYTDAAVICIDGHYSGSGTDFSYSHHGFDSLVWAENYAQQWQMGSESGNRNQNFNGPQEANDESYIHLVMVYDEDGTITLYRNGVVYGTPATGDEVRTFDADLYRFMFCQRHYSGGGSNPFNITYLAYYDMQLSERDVYDLWCNKFLPSGEGGDIPDPVCTTAPSLLPTEGPTQVPTVSTVEPTSVPTVVSSAPTEFESTTFTTANVGDVEGTSDGDDIEGTQEANEHSASGVLIIKCTWFLVIGLFFYIPS